MSRNSDGGDVNIPPLPVRRSAINSQSPATPRRIVQHQHRTTPTVRPELLSSSTSSSTTSRAISLAELRVNPSRSRTLNDYGDLPTTTTAANTVVRPGDAQLVRPDQTSSSTPWTKDDDRKKKSSKTSRSSSACRESIICQRCGRCRCLECARHTTSHPAVVEVCSCASCVRRVVEFRRRQRLQYSDDDDDDIATTADLCSCSPPRSDCRRRWALLVVLSVFLPCLCLYWPLRCVAAACSRCAGRRQVRGCHCVERHTPRLTTESVVFDRVTST